MVKIREGAPLFPSRSAPRSRLLPRCEPAHAEVASAPELEKATSRFYEAMKEKKSGFRDGVDELARICERMTKTDAIFEE